MKSTLIILIFFIQGISAFGQETDTIFYKDKWKSKPCAEKKAKFYEIKSIDHLGLETQALYSINDNKLILRRQYKDNFPAGVWEDNRYQGRNEILDYSFELNYSDKRIDGGLYPEIENNDNVDIATYQGGKANFYQYVAKTMRYPAFARRNGIEGKVFIHFKVSKDGSVQLLSVTRGVEKHLDQEAARMIVQSPDWVPAKLNGEPVDSYYIIPLTFRLG